MSSNLDDHRHLEGETMDSSVAPIHVIDELELKPGVDLDAFVAEFRSSYIVLAKQRGMSLRHLWVTPPEGPPAVNPTVIAVWELAGVPGFWQMRSQNSVPEVAAWWSRCDEDCVRRTRRFAVGVDDREAFSAAGRVHAP